MISGAVNNNIEPILPITVLSSDGSAHTIEALVDTGYNGYLCLSPALIQELGLGVVDDAIVTLADGSKVKLYRYGAQIQWLGIVRGITVLEAEGSPAIGMSLIYGSTLTVKAIEGGPVIISGLV